MTKPVQESETLLAAATTTASPANPPMPSRAPNPPPSTSVAPHIPFHPIFASSAALDAANKQISVLTSCLYQATETLRRQQVAQVRQQEGLRVMFLALQAQQRALQSFETQLRAHAPLQHPTGTFVSAVNRRVAAVQLMCSQQGDVMGDLEARLRVLEAGQRGREEVQADAGEEEGKEAAPSGLDRVGSEIGGGSSSGDIASADLISNVEIFGDLPIAYHPLYRYYRCTLCHTSTPRLQAHFGPRGPHRHVYTAPPILIARILAAYPEAYDPVTLLSPPPTVADPHPYIPGIPIASSGYACKACTYFAPNVMAIRQHIERIHAPSESVADSGLLEACGQLQRFFGRHKDRWFPTKLPLLGDFSAQEEAMLQPGVRQAGPKRKRGDGRSKAAKKAKGSVGDGAATPREARGDAPTDEGTGGSAVGNGEFDAEADEVAVKVEMF